MPATGSPAPQCSRQQAFQDEVNKYGVENAAIPTALLRLCGRRSPTIRRRSAPAQRSRPRATAPVTQKETIYGVAGHMHLRGHDIEVDDRPGTPKEQTLLHLPAWDFHWQDVYYLEHPVHVGPGDTMRVSCTFDNSKLDQPVVGTKQLRPRYVVWGEGTTDEMCLAMLSVAAGWK